MSRFSHVISLISLALSNVRSFGSKVMSGSTLHPIRNAYADHMPTVRQSGLPDSFYHRTTSFKGQWKKARRQGHRR